MPYVFYDTETSGVSTGFAQILQFAAIKTDDNLKEVERFEVRCRLLPHVIPAPGAMLVTRITPEMLMDLSLPSHYQAVQEIRNKLIEWSPAVFVGYNSIQFDEELLRQAFFQNLYPPYLTNMSGNQRSDIMRIAHCTNIYKPNSISIPLADNGNQTYKLDRLAPINGFEHRHAHEAMSDVEATIFVADLIRKRASGIWKRMECFTNKHQVVEFVKSEPCFSMSERYFGGMYSWLVTYCGQNPDYDSQLGVFDLSFNPDEYLHLSVSEIVDLLGKSPKVVRTLVANRQPIMMPLKDSSTNPRGPEISKEERSRRITIIQNDKRFKARVGDALACRFADRKPSPYVEQRIYERFPSRKDEALMREFHEENWKTRTSLIKHFEDDRLAEYARRLLFFERPDLLSNEVRQEMTDWLDQRILGSDQSVPWVTLKKAQIDLDALMQGTKGEQRGFLEDLKVFYKHRSENLSAC